MKKNGAIILGLLIAVTAFSGTNVGGGYYSDQLWNLSQSPYVVTQDVILFPGYKLTIEPGVQVLFNNNTGLTIRGELASIGTATDSIVFASNDSGAGTGKWAGITISNSLGGKGTLKYVKVSQSSSAINVECCGSGGPLAISHGRFFRNDCVSSSYAGWAMTFDSCVFENNVTVFTSADKVITNSIFRNNRYGLNSTERVSVSNCVFTGHSAVALYGGRGTVDSCTITGNTIAIKPFFEGFIVRNCTITGNDTGVILSNYDASSPAITHNRIDNTVNAINTDQYTKDMRYNWWGTTDAAQINSKIIDAHDNANLGIVQFSPYWANANGTDTLVDTSTFIPGSGTTLSGGLFSNTTLKKANSPYIVSGDVILFPGYTLNIEPGVKVLFNNNIGLTIRGEISAMGTIADSIVFASNDSGAGTGKWAGITISNSLGGKGTLKYVKVSQSSSAINVECCGNGGPLAISHGRFFKNDCVSSSYAGWATTFDSCVFENNATVFTSADKVITNSIFRNNEYGLNSTERVSVSNCVFTGHTAAALYGGRGTVSNVLIANNHIGIKGFFEGFTVERSCIIGNDTGVILSNYDGTSGSLSNNNIINKEMNVVNTGPYNVEIRYNWWGTTDTTQIHAKIHDGFDDPHLGLILQPIYMDSLGKDPTILMVTATGKDSASVQDSKTGTVVTVHASGSPEGRLAIAEGQNTYDDTNATLLKSVSIAPSSDLAGNLDTSKLTLYYGDKNYSGFAPGAFQIFWLQDTVWQKVGGVVDTAAKTVSVNVMHFSTYGIFANKHQARAMLRHAVTLKTALMVSRSLSRAQPAVAFSLAKPGLVRIDLYSTRGSLVRRLANGTYTEGVHQCFINSYKARIAAGLYIIRMSTTEGILTAPMNIMK